MREGIVRLLTEGGFEVTAQAGDADAFLRKALAHRPDVAVVDVRMPPGRSDDGLRAALELRRQRPETGVLVLSQYYDERYAVGLIGYRADGVGDPLKERVGDVDVFLDAVARVAAAAGAGHRDRRPSWAPARLRPGRAHATRAGSALRHGRGKAIQPAGDRRSPCSSPRRPSRST